MNLEQKLKTLPAEPGVYLMKNSSGQIIYVGKAKSLKNRVNQYFHKNKKSIKTINLVKNIADFDTIVCATELDALCLEARLIKKHQPFYNILLKDGKAYPYIRLDINEPYAIPTVVRKIKNDGAKYYGPFMLGVSPYEIIEVIQYAFGIRFCHGKITGTAKRECLNYSMHLCTAPCTGRISQEDYKLLLLSVEKFLKGDTALIKKILESKMTLQANMEQFETAIKYREKLRAIERLDHKYTVEIGSDEDADIIGLFSEGTSTGIVFMFYRGGKLFGKDSFIINHEDDDLISFFAQYYQDKEIPKNIYLSENFVDKTLFGEMLGKFSGRKIEVKIPQKAVHKKLTDIAVRNAKEYLEKNITIEKLYEERTTGALTSLKKILGLKNIPYRIEGYDISNISGVDKVASMVVFLGGEAYKSDYRKFKIKTVEGANDFASLTETLTRRLNELNSSDKSFSSVPNLILIDGGLGQLHAVCDLVKKVNPNIEVISIAKKEELVFTPYSSQPIVLKKSDYSLQLLQRVRDESHRFAITFFKNLHSKNMLKSELENIDGIGKAKAKALLEYFSTPSQIKKASVDELTKVNGISPSLAENIYNYFKEKQN